MENNEQVKWKSIDKILRHLFTGEDYNRAIDYIRTLYLKPTVKLPVLLLWGNEQCTGKTSFLHLLKAIFNDDMRIVDTTAFNSDFNGSWIGKRIVAIDECYIDTSDNRLVYRLSRALTFPTLQTNIKGKEPKEIGNNSAWIICTNDAELVKKTSPYVDFWSVKTEAISSEEIDQSLHEHVTSELPAFLEFLQHPIGEKLFKHPILERFLKVKKDYDYNRKQALEEALSYLQSEWIRRNNIRVDFELRIRNISDEELKEIEEQVREELFPTKDQSSNT